MLYDFSVLSSTESTRTKDGGVASDKLTRHFYEDGLEKDVKQYFESSYSTILNALMRACSISTNMVDPALVLGLSMRGLYDRATWRGQAGKDGARAIRLIDAVRRGVERAS